MSKNPTKGKVEESEQQKVELSVKISHEEMSRLTLTKEQILDWLKILKSRSER